MSNITDLLAAILAAKKGEEVRGSIHDAIELCYQDGKAGASDLQARQLIEAVAEVNEQQAAALEVLQVKIEELEESEGGTQQSTTVDIPTVLVDGGVEENVAVNNNSTVIHHVTFTTEFTEIPRVMVAIGKNAGAVSQYGYLSANILYPTVSKTGFDFFLANRTGSDRSPGVVWYAYQPTVKTIDLDITIPDAQGMTEAQVRKITSPISAAVDAIKTGYDGTVYQTAAEAVRSQINALHILIGDEPGTAISASAIGYGEESVEDALDGLNGRLVEVTENSVSRTRNLINTANNKVGYIFNTSSSAYVASENWISTDYIAVEAGGVYTFTYGNGTGYTMSQFPVLDSNKTYLGAATKSGRSITVPAELTGAAYLVLCTNNATAKANADTWMLVSGTDTDYNYTPYYQPIYKSAIVQTTGTETDKIMSQKAVTDAVNTVASTVGSVSTVANSAYAKAEQALEAGGGSANLRYPYKVQIPAYFVDDTTNKTLYLSDKINKIKGYNADLNFVFITDLHWNLNQKKSLQLIGYISQCLKVDAIINGGDNIGNAGDMPTVAIAEYYSRQCQDAFTDVVEKDNWMYVFGNHDLNMANAGSLTDEQRVARRLSFDFIYKTYIEPWSDNKVFESVSTESDLYWYSKIHYYSDDVGKNVRYIVMNTGTPYNPYASQVGEATAELYGQMDWLYNTIMSTPAGYRIIVFGHQFYAASFSGFTGSASWVSRMLRAAALKTSISLTATYLGESFARTYNFASANNIDVVGMFCGHEHGDKSAVWSGSAWNSFVMDATDCENAGDVLTICTDSDANGATHNVPELDRTTGTIGEQCFDVFSVDFTNKKIYATRIGCGSDREFTFA